MSGIPGCRRGEVRAIVAAMRRPTANPILALVVECFAPASDDADTRGVAERVAAASAGAGITYLGALISPDDELAFHAFETSDVDTVLGVSNRAGLRVERVVRSVLLVSVQPERSIAH